MGEKDIAEKTLESYDDVFADIVNVLLFSGKQILAPEDLEDQAPRSFYKAGGKLHELERDVAKRWKKGNIRIACVGFENQTAPDPDMVLRIMGYDGAEYRAQLLAEHTGNSRYPVVTLVLYFGEKPWDQPRSLKERLTIPPELEPYFSDYRINLFELAYLTWEQVSLFRSDFRVVADYFVQKREKHDYQPEPLELTHIQETLQLLSVMANDHRFEDAYYLDNGTGGGIRTMCDVLDRIEQKGRQEGRLEGRLEGRQEGRLEGRQEGRLEGRQEGEWNAKREMAVSLAGMGLSPEKIAEAARVSVDIVRQWLAPGGSPAT